MDSEDGKTVESGFPERSGPYPRFEGLKTKKTMLKTKIGAVSKEFAAEGPTKILKFRAEAGRSGDQCRVVSFFAGLRVAVKNDLQIFLLDRDSVCLA